MNNLWRGVICTEKENRITVETNCNEIYLKKYERRDRGITART